MIKIHFEKQNIQIIISKHRFASNLEFDEAVRYSLSNIDCALLRQSLWDIEDEGEIRKDLEHDKAQRRRNLKFSEVARLFYKPL